VQIYGRGRRVDVRLALHIRKDCKKDLSFAHGITSCRDKKTDTIRTRSSRMLNAGRYSKY
jgi:hypothetical protein